MSRGGKISDDGNRSCFEDDNDSVLYITIDESNESGEGGHAELGKFRGEGRGAE